MSYQKPTVTVRQVQVTQSLPLPSPNFESCIVGKGYHWQDPLRDDSEVSSIAAAPYDGTALTINISEFTDLPASGLVEESLIVEVIRTKGSPGSGEVKTIPNDLTTGYQYSAGAISIAADVAGYTTGSGDEGKIRVGFLIERPELEGKFTSIVETQDIIDLIGDPKPFNPLAFGASLAMMASGRSTNVLGASEGSFATVEPKLQSEDVYVIAGLSGDTGDRDTLSSHVTQMALPENKKERIAFACPTITFTGEDSYNSNTAINSDRTKTAETIRDNSAGVGNKRMFQVAPDAGWVEAEVHVSTLRSGFIQSVYGTSFDLMPKIKSNVTIAGKRYRAYDDITDEVIDGLISDGKMSITAYYPIPGYMFTASIAGLVAAKEPAKPLTNSRLPGISMVSRSNGYFSPSQLDIIASGGTWVLEQRTVGTIVNRHQMSTDAVTIEARELSITTQVDYAANYLRDLVSPLIGTEVISTSFIKRLEAVMNGAAIDLVERRNVRDLSIQNVYQDDLEPDTVKADILLLPLYPLNYIKITLEF